MYFIFSYIKIQINKNLFTFFIFIYIYIKELDVFVTYSYNIYYLLFIKNKIANLLKKNLLVKIIKITKNCILLK